MFVSLVFICLSLFSFKQKTAYEVRIGDWSSDVCSSELRRASVPDPTRPSVHRNGRWPQTRGGRRRDQSDTLAALIVERWRDQIGRAACRERVCQYGSISVGAVELQNKPI